MYTAHVWYLYQISQLPELIQNHKESDIDKPSKYSIDANCELQIANPPLDLCFQRSENNQNPDRL